MGLVEITNGHVVVGILPALGGRVVRLETAGGENLLDSDPQYWKAPFPKPSLERAFAPWNGRVVWVGPQSGFWSQQDLRPESVLFTTHKGVPNGLVENVRYIILIDSRSYDAMPTDDMRSRLARAVGMLNYHPELVAGTFVLIGPGRWGSTNIRLGVQATYAEISNTTVLVEMARQKEGRTPEVSYGTDFFQDLVESQIHPLPL